MSKHRCLSKDAYVSTACVVTKAAGVTVTACVRAAEDLFLHVVVIRVNVPCTEAWHLRDQQFLGFSCSPGNFGRWAQVT